MKCAVGTTSRELEQTMRRDVLLALLGAACSASAAAAECASDLADLRLGESQWRFRIEVVDTDAERARGLMFQENLPKFGGMLFVYEDPQPVSFWMKNTLIPLDMLFFDQSGRLVNLGENAVPGDPTPIPGEGQVQYVLEINGGLAAELGISPGAELKHPAIDPSSAAWACED
jgi:uncharacterized protein